MGVKFKGMLTNPAEVDKRANNKIIKPFTCPLMLLFVNHGVGVVVLMHNIMPIVLFINIHTYVHVHVLAINPGNTFINIINICMNILM